jgi:probable phosphomutase (TIGR03848 family)
MSGRGCPAANAGARTVGCRRVSAGCPGTIVVVSDTTELTSTASGSAAGATATAEPAGATAPAGAAESPGARAVTTLLLVRHAVTHQTGPMLSGRTPGIDLSEAGRAQAEAVGRRLAGLPVVAVYASPIERTTQTAQAIAAHHDLEVRPLPGVIEADYGDWTGGKLADLAKTDLWKTVQLAPSRASFPGGESLAGMQARMVAALERVAADDAGALIVVVSHADPIKAAIAHFTGVHLDLFQRIVVSPASVTALALSSYGAALVKCNDTGDLAELVPAPPAGAGDGDGSTGPDGAAAGQGAQDG